MKEFYETKRKLNIRFNLKKERKKERKGKI